MGTGTSIADGRSEGILFEEWPRSGFARTAEWGDSVSSFSKLVGHVVGDKWISRVFEFERDMIGTRDDRGGKA
jgi:hypothetical protein